MYFSSVDEGVGRFGQVEYNVGGVDIGLEMMTDGKIFHDAAFVLNDVLVGPYAVISVDGIIGEEEEVFRA